MSCIVEYEGCTIPDNHQHQEVWCPAPGSSVPGYSITDEDWDKSKIFEETASYIARKAIAGEANFVNLSYEIEEAKQRGDVQAVVMLQSAFNKGHFKAYGYVPSNHSGYYSDEARDYFTTVFSNTGKFTVMET